MNDAYFLLLIQDFQPLFPCPRAKHEIMRLGSLKLKPEGCEDPWKPVSGLSESNQYVKIDSTAKRPLLTDLQGMQIILLSVELIFLFKSLFPINLRCLLYRPKLFQNRLTYFMFLALFLIILLFVQHRDNSRNLITILLLSFI